MKQIRKNLNQNLIKAISEFVKIKSEFLKSEINLNRKLELRKQFFKLRNYYKRKEKKLQERKDKKERREKNIRVSHVFFPLVFVGDLPYIRKNLRP